MYSIRRGRKDKAEMNLSVVVGADGLAVVGGYSATHMPRGAVDEFVSSRSLSTSSLAFLASSFLDVRPVQDDSITQASVSRRGGADA